MKVSTIKIEFSRMGTPVAVELVGVNPEPVRFTLGVVMREDGVSGAYTQEGLVRTQTGKVLDAGESLALSHMKEAMDLAKERVRLFFPDFPEIR